MAALAAFAAGAALAVPGASGSVSSCPVKPAAPSSGGAAANMLVRAKASRVLLCRYRFDRLQGRGLIARPATIATLTHELDALRPMPPGNYSCPADFGVLVIGRFVYRSAAPDTVRVDETGCTPVSNGRLHRWAAYPPGPRLLRQLLSYTGCRPARRSPACP